MSANRAASVRARLLAWSKANGQEFQRVLVRFGLERLLYRLSVSAHRDDFVLKGALLFWLWEGAIPRPTRDADMLLRGDVAPDRMKALFEGLCRAEEDDGLVFDPASVEVSEIRTDDEYQGTRVVLRAYLDRAEIRLQVDVAVGDAVAPAPEAADFPTLLPMATPRLLVYPRETVVAEKLHAIVKLGLENSRLKDYFDLDRLAARYSFDGRRLVAAIRATFERRQMPLPDGLPPGLSAAYATGEMRETQWRTFQARLAARDPSSLAEVVEKLRLFLGPPLEGSSRPGHFDRRWAPGGPWSA